MLVRQAEESRKSELVDKSYELISKIYDTDKGRNFILHLVRAFLPIVTTYHNQLLSTDKRCSITNKLGFDFRTYSDMTVDTIFLRAKMEIGDDMEKEKAKKELEVALNKVRKHWNLDDDENMFDRKLIYSEKSDKLITMYSLYALQAFAINNNINLNSRNSIEKPYNSSVAEKSSTSTYTLGEKFGAILKGNG